MTGSSSNLKLLMLHDELKYVRESCSPPWRPCRGHRDSNPIPLDRAQKDGPEACVAQSLCALSPEIPGVAAPPHLYYTKKANQDRVNLSSPIYQESFVLLSLNYNQYIFKL